MVLGVGVEEAPNHALILGVVFARFVFEEVDAPLAEGDRDFDSFLPHDQVLGLWKEIRNDL
jgi:hypothetical protein